MRSNGAYYVSDGTQDGTHGIYNIGYPPSPTLIHGDTLYFQYNQDFYKCDGVLPPILVQHVDSITYPNFRPLIADDGFIAIGVEQRNGAAQVWIGDGATPNKLQFAPGIGNLPTGESPGGGAVIGGIPMIWTSESTFGSTLWRLNHEPEIRITAQKDPSQENKVVYTTTIETEAPLDTLQVSWSFNSGDPINTHSAADLGALYPTHLFTDAGYETATLSLYSNNELLATATHSSQTFHHGAYTIELGADAFDPSTTTLTITGSPRADKIQITPSIFQTTRVVIGRTVDQSFAITGRILVYGQGGADTITLGPGLNPVCHIDGGDGNDVLTNAGAGACVIIGGPGNDRLTALADDALLIGGAGRDKIRAGSSNVIVTGPTDFDQNHDALWHILAEWQRDDVPLFDRSNHIRGITTGGFNNAVFLDDSTTHDDAAQDTILASNGPGLWFAKTLGKKRLCDRGADTPGLHTLIELT